MFRKLTLFSLLFLTMFVLSVSRIGATESTTNKLDDNLIAALDSAEILTPLEVIVVYSDNSAMADLDALAIDSFDMVNLPMSGALLLPDQIATVADWDGVESITLNAQLDYFLSKSVSYIGADDVWSTYGQTGGNVAVAVLDSGIDGTHPDLLFGIKTIENVKVTPFSGVEVGMVNSDTSSGHGTHVASTIGGNGVMSDGAFRGVAPDVKLVGVSAGEAISILHAVQGYDWILSNHEALNIRIVNNSWGSSGGQINFRNPINIATFEAYKQGILSVFAAGNDGGYDIMNPYSLAPWVLSVAAGDTSGNLAGFSSRGKIDDPFKHPDLMAPGVDVVAARSSTVGVTATDPLPNETNPAYTAHYAKLSGTSMATPHVAGAAALLVSGNPTLSPDQMMDLLLGTLTPVTFAQHTAGDGYLDAFAAYEASRNVAGNLAAFKAGDINHSPEALLQLDDRTAYDTTTYTGFTSAAVTELPPNEYPFTVTDEHLFIDVSLSWEPQQLDAYDLEVVDADGNLVVSSGNSVGEAEQAIFVPAEAGVYTVKVVPFAAVATTYELTIAKAFQGPEVDQSGDSNSTNNSAVSTVESRVVVSVIDSAINPYHNFFNAGGRPYQNSAPTAVTQDVLDAFGIDDDHVLQLTRTGDFASDFSADSALWANVNPGEIYYFAGTNIIAISFDPGTRVIMPDDADDTHGVGTAAAVLDANPEAIVLFVEGINDEAETFAFTHPEVDIVSTSYGLPGSLPLPGHIENSYVGVVENGKMHFGAADNSPANSIPDGTSGPWWSIGVAGFEEYTSEGKQLVSGNFIDFVADFTQQLPYCHDCESDIRENVGGTSFSTPRSAGTMSAVLLEARRAMNHEGGIDGLAMAGDLTNWQLRRAMEEAAYYPDLSSYDPVVGVLEQGAPVPSQAPWLLTGWGVITPDTEHEVIEQTLAHLGLNGDITRSKDAQTCTFMTTLLTARHAYWDNANIDSQSNGSTADPYIYCNG